MIDQTVYTSDGIPAGSLAGRSEKSAAGTRGHFAKLLTAMFKIGLVGFGGGTALIPVIEEEVVDQQKLISKADYDEDVLAACVTPGALPVEIAAGNGRRSYGIRGMILSALMIALPGALLTVAILSLLAGSTETTLQGIRYLSVGIGSYIASLLIAYAVKSQKSAAAESRQTGIASLIIIAAVFLLTGGKNLLAILGISSIPVFQLSTVEVLGIAFGAILFTEAVRKVQAKRSFAETGAKAAVKADWKELFRETAAWAAFALTLTVPALILNGHATSLVFRGLLSSILSFGGGDAYLSIADGLFVNSGIVSRTAFYGTLVPVVNILPGSILTKVLTGVGFISAVEAGGTAAAGYFSALAGFGISVAASACAFGAVCWVFRTFRNVSIFRQISRWIRPIISGLLLNVMLTMVRTGVETGTALGKSSPVVLLIIVGIVAFDTWLILRKKINNLIPLTASAVIGAALLWLAV